MPPHAPAAAIHHLGPWAPTTSSLRQALPSGACGGGGFPATTTPSARRWSANVTAPMPAMRPPRSCPSMNEPCLPGSIFPGSLRIPDPCSGQMTARRSHQFRGERGDLTDAASSGGVPAAGRRHRGSRRGPRPPARARRSPTSTADGCGLRRRRPRSARFPRARPPGVLSGNEPEHGQVAVGEDEARIFAFSRSNSSAEVTSRSRRPASFASWSAVPAGRLAAARWIQLRHSGSYR